MVEIARTCGLSRKAAYDAIGRAVDDENDRRWGIETSILCLLAGRGAMSVEMVDGVLRVGQALVRQELERLVGARAARRLIGQSGGNSVAYYDVDRAVAARMIARRLEDIRGMPSETYSVYFGLTKDEIAPIGHATEEIVPGCDWTIIPLGNNSAATTDELAVAVRAPDRRVAFETAAQLWREIADRAGVARGPQITQLIDPHSCLST